MGEIFREIFEQPDYLRNQTFKRFGSMADVPLDGWGKLTECLMKFWHKEQWVVTKAVFAVIVP